MEFAPQQPLLLEGRALCIQLLSHQPNHPLPGAYTGSQCLPGLGLHLPARLMSPPAGTMLFQNLIFFPSPLYDLSPAPGSLRLAFLITLCSSKLDYERILRADTSGLCSDPSLVRYWQVFISLN